MNRISKYTCCKVYRGTLESNFRCFLCLRDGLVTIIRKGLPTPATIDEKPTHPPPKGNLETPHVRKSAVLEWISAPRHYYSWGQLIYSLGRKHTPLPQLTPYAQTPTPLNPTIILEKKKNDKVRAQTVKPYHFGKKKKKNETKKKKKGVPLTEPSSPTYVGCFSFSPWIPIVMGLAGREWGFPVELAFVLVRMLVRGIIPPPH